MVLTLFGDVDGHLLPRILGLHEQFPAFLIEQVFHHVFESQTCGEVQRCLHSIINFVSNQWVDV